MTLNSVINLRNREMIYIRIYTLSFLNISKARQFYGQHLFGLNIH